MAFIERDVLVDLNNLITEITGFKDKDENFQTCQQYCLSHVVHGTYPSISRRKVEEDVQVYAARFFTHGYFDVRQEFLQQVENFLQSQDLFEKNSQFDIQWRLLNFLFELSSNLTSMNKVPEMLSPTTEEEEDEEVQQSCDSFNWPEYLKDGLTTSQQYTETELDSFDESFEEESSVFVSAAEAVQTAEYGEGAAAMPTPPPPPPPPSAASTRSPSDVRADLARATAVQSLLESVRNQEVVSEVERRLGTFTYTYNAWLQDNGVSTSFTVLPQVLVIRNVLYYLETGKDVMEGRNVALINVTQFAVAGYMNSIKLYATAMKELNDFIREVDDTRSNGGYESLSYMLKTYKVALDKALQPYRHKLRELRQSYNSLSLLIIQYELSPLWSVLVALASCHRRATASWRTADNWETSVRILCVLHHAIRNKTIARHVYISMFLPCMEVYLDIVHRWLTCKRLIDPAQDFVIAESSQEGVEGDVFVRPYQNVVADLHMYDAPAFLDLLADKMCRAGHSLCVLGKIPKLYHHLHLTRDPTKPGFFMDFCQRLNAELKLPVVPQPVASPMISEYEAYVIQRSFCPISMPGTWDWDVWKTLEPIFVVMDRCLDTLLWDRLDFVKTEVREVLQSLQLQPRLALLRSVLLFNDMTCIQPFIDHLFTQPDYWIDPYSLSTHLQDSLEKSFPSFYADVSVTVSKDAKPDNILEAIDGLTVLLKVEWPLDVVLSATCMAMYNDVFRHLLKVKWASTTLANMGLRVTDAPNIRPEILCRLRSLRFWCMNLLGQISNMYMAQVFTKFDLDQHSPFIKDVSHAHEAFIEDVHRRCLLDEEGRSMRECIFQELVPLCVDLEHQWKEGVLTTRKVDLLQQMFSSVEQRLSHLFRFL